MLKDLLPEAVEDCESCIVPQDSISATSFSFSSNKRGKVWAFFERKGAIVECQIRKCKATLKFSSSTHSNMVNHLKFKHRKIWNEGWNKTEERNMPQAIHKLFHTPTYNDELLKE
jgi:hypothetical protein